MNRCFVKPRIIRSKTYCSPIYIFETFTNKFLTDIKIKKNFAPKESE